MHKCLLNARREGAAVIAHFETACSYLMSICPMLVVPWLAAQVHVFKSAVTVSSFACKMARSLTKGSPALYLWLFLPVAGTAHQQIVFPQHHRHSAIMTAPSRSCLTFLVWLSMQGISAVLAQHRDTVGMVHLALHDSAQGPICTWHQELEAIAEPSMPIPSEFALLGISYGRVLGAIRAGSACPSMQICIAGNLQKPSHHAVYEGFGRQSCRI